MTKMRNTLRGSQTDSLVLVLKVRLLPDGEPTICIFDDIVTGPGTFSYTTLTLPTILHVSVSDVAVTIKNKKTHKTYTTMIIADELPF